MAPVLSKLLAYSKMHSYDSFTQSEQSELFQCMDFVNTWVARETSFIIDHTVKEDSYDDAIEEWANDLQSKLDYLVKAILDTPQASKASSAKSTPTSNETLAQATTSAAASSLALKLAKTSALSLPLTVSLPSTLQ